MTSKPAQYTVVARRYRPQTFVELVGQNQIALALSNAIKQNRVGHAYLFTGARGVGKTSSARIFAKCLNCVQGPTEQPCNECDICAAVSVGEDMDVLEIDGASNRGIDEIRQLRSNAIVRPSRAKYKVYIIDEVHMLTSQAFNALLKTLEEPPDHVKFIFCTTDPQKIPITVLSRCQRFDFSPVQTAEIISRLQAICEAEKIEAEPQALAVLARRAGGSMRDSQSLLEQLFSFCDGTITVGDVHQLLGTADTSRITAIATAMVAKDSADCMNQLSAAIEGGVDAGQFASQLLGYFRDVMAIRVGADGESLLTCTESDIGELKNKADILGLETTLSVIQILDQCVTRMQSSLHGRTLLEVAIVRICNLENLDLLADLLDQLGTGSPTDKNQPTISIKKKPLIEPVSGSRLMESAATGTAIDSHMSIGISAAEANESPGTIQPPNLMKTPRLDLENLPVIWHSAASSLGEMAMEMMTQYQSLELADDSTIVVTYAAKHVWEFCRRSDRAIAMGSALQQMAGTSVQIQFCLAEPTPSSELPKAPKLTRVQMIRQLEQNPLVKCAIEVFDAEVVEFRAPVDGP